MERHDHHAALDAALEALSYAIARRQDARDALYAAWRAAWRARDAEGRQPALPLLHALAREAAARKLV